jgi:hypothetical protein
MRKKLQVGFFGKNNKNNKKNTEILKKHNKNGAFLE